MKKFQKVLSSAIALLAAGIIALPANISTAAAAKEATSVTLTNAAKTKKISSCKITVTSAYAYTGKAIKPKVKITDGKKTLKSGTHYTVKYSSNKAIGVGKITITGVKKNGYTGSKTVTFKIVPGKPSVKATATSTTVKLTWNKVKGASKYIVYRYDSSKKAYKKIATVSSASYTDKKLKSNTTYLYKVKASATKDKKTYTGNYSNKVTAVTGPAKVSSLTAKSTSNSVTLSWKKVSGASSYTVYKYDSSKKTYSVVKSAVKNTSYKISSLSASTTYKYAVAAVKTSGKKSYTGDKSSVVTIKTAAAATPAPTPTPEPTPSNSLATLNGCYNLFRSGTFKVKCSIPVTSTENFTTTINVKGNQVALTFTEKDMDSLFGDDSMADLGISANMKIIKNPKDGKVYTLIDMSIFKLYMKMTDAETKEFEQFLDVNAVKEIFAPEKASSAAITKSTKTVGGKKYTCESYTAKNGANVTYYFYNNALSIIEVTAPDGTTMNINIASLSSSVKSDDVKMPTAFPIGWTNIDDLDKLLG